ncbi:MAG: UvrD-helicase domain-containing protein, partial [Brevinema sp.]
CFDLINVLDCERNYSKGKLTSENEKFYQNLKQIDADSLTKLFIPSLIGKYTNSNNKNKPLKDEALTIYRDQSEEAYRLFVDSLYRVMIPLLLPVSDLCTTILKEKQKKNQAISFAESEFIFLDALKQEFFVKKIQSRIRFFFADEFQDTSDIQKEIFDFILTGKHIIPFFVGDPKQSIYSFRKANVTIFQKTIEEFNNKSSLQKFSGQKSDDQKSYRVAYLNTNYRSARTYVDVVNTLFMDIFSQDQSGICYQDQLSKNEDQGKFSYTLALGVDDPTNAKTSEKEQQSYKDALSVIDHYLKTEVSPSHIMVLFQNNKNILEFYYLVKKYQPDLPISSSIKNLLWDSEYLASLMSFLRAVMRPYHNLTMVELLKTPFFRKTDDEITMMILSAQKEKKYLFDMLAQEDKVILDDFMLLKDKISIEEFVNILIKRLSYEEFLLSFPNFGDALATLRLFVEEAKNINQKKSLSLAEFVQFIDNKKPQMNEAEFSGEEGKTLRLMTVHSSKGLESPYVIYVHSPKNKEKLVRYPQYQKGHVAFDVFGKGQIAADVADFVKTDNTSEQKRLAYVALTRAKQEFVYCGLPSRYRKDKTFETHWESFLHKELIETYFSAEDHQLDLPEISECSHASESQDSFALYQKRFEELHTQSHIFEELPQFLSVSLLLDAEFNPEEFDKKYNMHSFNILEQFRELTEKDGFSLSKSDEGQLVHELLQKFDAPSFEDAQQYLNSHHQDKKNIFPNVLDYAFSYWDSSFYQGIIKNSSSQDKERQVVCLIKNNIIVRSSSDTYISSDQGCMIVDYKLSLSPKNVDRYVRQISYYALLSEKSGHPVDKIFLFNLKEGKEIEILWNSDEAETYFDNAVDKALQLLQVSQIS